MEHFAVRLNDGETWTNADKCEILIFDEEPTDEMIKDGGHGIENLLAELTVSDDEDKKLQILTWKKTHHIDIYEVWDR